MFEDEGSGTPDGMSTGAASTGASLLQPPLTESSPARNVAPRSQAAYRRTAPVEEPPEYEEPEYYDDEEEEEYYYSSGSSVMMNPFLLAAGAVVAAVLLAIFVVFFFGQGNDGAVSDNGNVAVTPTGTRTNGAAFIGLQARSSATATVREGPGPNYLGLGLLQARQDVDITGRDEDGTWYQIVFPAYSNLRGWVPATALQLPENALELVALAEVTPVPRPEVEDPTPVPVIPDDDEEEPEVPEETPTPDPGRVADISVSIASNCAPNSAMALILTNVGTLPLEAAPIQILIANNGSIVYDRAFEADMVPGASVPLVTEVPAQPTTMTVTVLLQSEEDVNAGNNVASCTVQGGGNVPPPIGGNATPGNNDDDDD